MIVPGTAAPSVTLEHIESLIVKEEYVVYDGRLTTCYLTLKNGHVQTGESACACVENFNKEKGEKYAKENAINAIWALEGYLLKQRLYESTTDSFENHIETRYSKVE